MRASWLVRISRSRCWIARLKCPCHHQRIGSNISCDNCKPSHVRYPGRVPRDLVLVRHARSVISSHTTPDLAIAQAGAVLLGNATTNATTDLITRLRGRVASRAAIEPITPSLPAEPLRDLELLTRGCWALALLTEVYRGGPIPGTVIDRYAHASGAPTADGLLTLAPAEAVTELSRLLDLAFQQLLPDLRARPAPWYVGPTFTLSTALGADADLIAYHTLVEIKTGLGRKTNDGRRAASLELVTLRQLLGYALHDVDDTFSLREVAVYDARFAYIDSWQLQGMLDSLAGRTVDLPAERAAWRLALTG
jgi:hypothetical protein